MTALAAQDMLSFAWQAHSSQAGSPYLRTPCVCPAWSTPSQ